MVWGGGFLFRSGTTFLQHQFVLFFLPFARMCYLDRYGIGIWKLGLHDKGGRDFCIGNERLIVYDRIRNLAYITKRRWGYSLCVLDGGWVDVS